LSAASISASGAFRRPVEGGDADAERDLRMVGGRRLLQAQAGDVGADAVGQHARLFQSSLGQHRRELFAAIARRQVGRPLEHAGQLLGHHGQAAVALLVAEVVVIGLERIDIDQQQRQRAIRALRAAQFALQRHVEMAAVGDPGQAIDIGTRAQRFGVLHQAPLAHRDAAHVADLDQAEALAAFVERRDRDRLVDQGAVETARLAQREWRTVARGRHVLGGDAFEQRGEDGRLDTRSAQVGEDVDQGMALHPGRAAAGTRHQPAVPEDDATFMVEHDDTAIDEIERPRRQAADGFWIGLSHGSANVEFGKQFKSYRSLPDQRKNQDCRRPRRPGSRRALQHMPGHRHADDRHEEQQAEHEDAHRIGQAGHGAVGALVELAAPARTVQQHRNEDEQCRADQYQFHFI